MGAGAADIAEVVSDVRERLPGLQSAPQLEPDQARFRLFDSIAAFLKTASQRQPLVLVLDDLHWADQPSLLLLQFVSRELGGARLLVQEGELSTDKVGQGDSWTIRIPEGVREVIGRRLNRLSQRCNEALTVASILGREFTLAQLRPLVEEVTEDRLFEILEEALASRVIEELPQSVGSYQFTHALIQETLSSELSLTRKVRLHAQIAQALEDLYGDEAESHAAELAHHFGQAEAVAGTEKLVRYSLLAGERALASSAYEDALAHFGRGLAARGIALSGTVAARDEEAAALLFGHGRAQSLTGGAHQLVEAFANLSRAFEYYFESGDVAQAVAAAEFQIAPTAQRIQAAAELIARALTLVPADSHEARRLLSRYGGILGTAEGDYEGAQLALSRAIAIARREGDVALEMQTLAYASAVSSAHLHWQESVDNGLRAIELATGDGNTVSDYVSRVWTALSLLAMGELDAARPYAFFLRDRAERRGTPRPTVAFSLMLNTILSGLEGDWTAAREYSDRGLDVSPLHPQLLFARVLLEHETGESAQGEIYLERLLEATPETLPLAMVPIAIASIARITGVPDRLKMAGAAAEAVLSEQVCNPSFNRVGQGRLGPASRAERRPIWGEGALCVSSGAARHDDDCDLHIGRPPAWPPVRDLRNLGASGWPFRRRPGLLPQGGLPARVGLDLLRLRRHASGAGC
jgi:hypothetical protein